MLVPKVVLLVYAVLQIIWAKLVLFMSSVSRAYRNSRLYVRLMKKSEATISSRKLGHNAAVEVYHNTNVDKDMQIFKNKQADDLFWKFSNYGPAFSVVPEDVTFLKEPCDFYQELLDGISRARNRIVLASLYLGSSKLETAMIDAVHTAMSKSPTLEATFLLDCMRGRRGGKVPTGGEAKVDIPKSSLQLLRPLVQQFPGRVKVNLYHTPDLRGFWKRVIPNTYNESIGVSHIKAYIFDDDIIISGANLSHDYFTNRQDRFCLIKNHVSLTTYFYNLIDVIGSFSNIMNEEGEVVLANKDVDADKDHVAFRNFAKSKIEPFLQPRTFYSAHSNIPAHRLGKHLPDMDILAGKKTWLFPSLQMAPLHVRHDEVLTSSVLSAEHDLYLASPYLNLTPDYTKRIMTSKTTVDIITASPETNGWYKAKGLASGITTMYTFIEQKFYGTLKEAGQLERIKLHEYCRPDWTFHSKGLWAVLPGESLPYLTTVGSPNFGGRSVEKDLEAQVFILTENETLMQKIEEERLYLFTTAQKVDEELLHHPTRQVGMVLRFLAKIGSNFL